jgi:hypothetical protein
MFESLTVVNIKFMVFCAMTWCSLVDVNTSVWRNILPPSLGFFYPENGGLLGLFCPEYGGSVLFQNTSPY